MSNPTKMKNPMKVVTGRDTRWSYANVPLENILIRGPDCL